MRKPSPLLMALTAIVVLSALAAPVAAGDGRPPAPLKRVRFTYAPAGAHQKVMLAGTFNQILPVAITAARSVLPTPEAKAPSAP